MAIYKASNQVGKLYKGSNQIGKVYKGSTLVYQAEETIFSGISVQTAATGDDDPYDSETAYSSVYSIDFSQWDKLTITGIVGCVRTNAGSYNRSHQVALQYSVDGGSTYSNLSTLYDVYVLWDESATVNTTVDISSLTATNGRLRIYCWVRNSNTESTSSGYTYCNTMTCIAE